MDRIRHIVGGHNDACLHTHHHGRTDCHRHSKLAHDQVLPMAVVVL